MRTKKRKNKSREMREIIRERKRKKTLTQQALLKGKLPFIAIENQDIHPSIVIKDSIPRNK